MTPEKLAALKKQKEDLEKQIKEVETQLEEQNHPLVKEIEILKKQLDFLHNKLKKKDNTEKRDWFPTSPGLPKFPSGPNSDEPRFIPSLPRPEKFYYSRPTIIGITPWEGYYPHLVPYAISTKGKV